MYSYLIRDGKEVVFVLVPGHVGVNDDSAANSAAKNALDGDVSDNYIPFSDLKPRLNNYITELWQTEISPKINKFLASCRSNRREETSVPATFWPCIHDSLFLVESRRSSLLHSLHVVAHVLFHCTDDE